MTSPALERMLRITALYDLYGGLLTDRQSEFLELHYMRDLSLAEISEKHGVSRQSVHDTLTRAESSLEWIESSLHLLERLEAARQASDSAIRRCRDLGLLLRSAEIAERGSAAGVEQLLVRLSADLNRLAGFLRFGPLTVGDEIGESQST